VSHGFIRAPLFWGVGFVALYAPLAFVEPVIAPPPPDCTDWLWCDHTYEGLMLTARPHAEHLYALIAIPNALLCFFAAHVSGASRRYWFMAGPILAVMGACIYSFSPYSITHLFMNADVSFQPAVWFVSLRSGLMLGAVLGLPMALATWLGAAAWRFVRRRQRLRTA
jgi:hypothetical protein